LTRLHRPCGHPLPLRGNHIAIDALHGKKLQIFIKKQGERFLE
jgi:hypothetical protein